MLQLSDGPWFDSGWPDLSSMGARSLCPRKQIQSMLLLYLMLSRATCSMYIFEKGCNGQVGVICGQRLSKLMWHINLTLAWRVAAGEHLMTSTQGWALGHNRIKEKKYPPPKPPAKSAGSVVPSRSSSVHKHMCYNPTVLASGPTILIEVFLLGALGCNNKVRARAVLC